MSNARQRERITKRKIEKAPPDERHVDHRAARRVPSPANRLRRQSSKNHSAVRSPDARLSGICMNVHRRMAAVTRPARRSPSRSQGGCDAPLRAASRPKLDSVALRIRQCRDCSPPVPIRPRYRTCDRNGGVHLDCPLFCGAAFLKPPRASPERPWDPHRARFFRADRRVVPIGLRHGPGARHRVMPRYF